MTLKYHYISVEENYRQNGHRHLERAINYISAGYPDRFADGSLRKAIKNFKKADELVSLMITPDWFKSYLKMMENHIAQLVADQIINGIDDVNLILQKVADAIKAANDDLYAILKYNVRDSSWEIWIDNKPAEVNFKDYNKAEDRCEDLNYLYAARKAVEALKGDVPYAAKIVELQLDGPSLGALRNFFIASDGDVGALRFAENIFAGNIQHDQYTA